MTDKSPTHRSRFGTARTAPRAEEG